MADGGQAGAGTGGDVLDDFFSAAGQADPELLNRAARNVAEGRSGGGAPAGAGRDAELDEILLNLNPGAPWNPDDPALDGKFVAVDGGGREAPLVLIPARIHTLLPGWTWAAIAISLLLLMAGVLFVPALRLGQLTSRLGDGNPAVVQAAMRELAASGDERAVTRLYGLAASPEEAMPYRLRAIDTLGLIQSRGSESALRRLETAERSEPPIREAASAARKRRNSAQGRSLYR